jgi:hypothetical protein
MGANIYRPGAFGSLASQLVVCNRHINQWRTTARNYCLGQIAASDSAGFVGASVAREKLAL